MQISMQQHTQDYVHKILLYLLIAHPNILLIGYIYTLVGFYLPGSKISQKNLKIHVQLLLQNLLQKDFDYDHLLLDY